MAAAARTVRSGRSDLHFQRGDGQWYLWLARILFASTLLLKHKHTQLDKRGPVWFQIKNIVGEHHCIWYFEISTQNFSQMKIGNNTLPLRLFPSISPPIEGAFSAVLRQQVLRPSIGCPAAVSNLLRLELVTRGIQASLNHIGFPFTTDV